MSYQSRYAMLNSAQKHAVDTIEGPVLVIAGPGTGKTELLGMRVASILKKTDSLPENILCLTFTDSGAQAMRERLKSIIGKDAYRVAIHTFHSFGSEIINHNSEYFYQGADFQAANELTTYQILRDIFSELPYSSPLSSTNNGDYVYLNEAKNIISELKRSGLTSEELLLVLAANEAFIETVEPALSEIFSARISKSTAESLRVFAQHKPALLAQSSPLPAGLSLLQELFFAALERSLSDYDSLGKTTPITAFKNKWFEKNSLGQIVFSDRKRNLKLREMAAIYRLYQDKNLEERLYDFDDMILRVVQALTTHADLRFNLQEKYHYIMVDEFQDTNLAQMRIIENLTDNELYEGRPNIMAVGDDDQAIYSFQGADINNIHSFTNLFTRPEIITLTDNYRSVESVLSHARQVITQSSERIETLLSSVNKTLTAHRQHSAAEVSLHEYPSIHEERHAIVEQISHQLADPNHTGDIAVLARRHKELIELLPYFAANNIPVIYERQDNVLEQEPVSQLLALAKILQAVLHGNENLASELIAKLITHPAWGYTPEQIIKLSIHAYKERKSWLEVMGEMGEFTALYSWITAMAVKATNDPLEYILDELMGAPTPAILATAQAATASDKTDEPFDEHNTAATATEFTSPLYNYFFSDERRTAASDDYITHLDSLRTIRQKLREYTNRTEKPTLVELIEFIELHEEMKAPIKRLAQHGDTNQSGVHLMTAHKSKGLEFDTVYIINATDANWGEKAQTRPRLISYPANLPLETAGSSISERIRLFFVAMTRAKQQLRLSYGLSDDADKATLPASFLVDVELEAQNKSAFASDVLARKTRSELAWYAPILAIPQPTLESVLVPRLSSYALSATDLNAFLDVTNGGPQAFLVDKLLRFPRHSGPQAAYGTAIHFAIQKAHAHFSATKEYRPLEDSLHDFQSQLEKSHLRDHELQEYTRRGIATLEKFLPAKQSTFSTGQKVELSFAHQNCFIGDAHISGALDLVDLSPTDKLARITDYKTGKSLADWKGKSMYDKVKLHTYRRQLGFYQLLLATSRDYRNYHTEDLRISFVEPLNLHAPEATFSELSTTFNRDELARLEQLIRAVWHCICRADFPNTSEYDPTLDGILAFEDAVIKKYIDTL